MPAYLPTRTHARSLTRTMYALRPHAQGSSIETYNRNRAELRRLQCLDAIGNKAYVDAKAASTQTAATLAHLQQALSAVRSQGMLRLDPEQIKRDVQARQHAKDLASAVPRGCAPRGLLHGKLQIFYILTCAQY